MKKVINLSLILAMLLGFLPPTTATAVITPLREQLPNNNGDGSSEIGSSLLAEDFILAEASSIGQIEIWNRLTGPVDIYFIIYANTTDGGGYDIPGDSLYSGMVSSSGVDEEDTICSTIFCQYRHTLTLDSPLDLTPGHYWLSVYGLSGSIFAWAYAETNPDLPYIAVKLPGSEIWTGDWALSLAFRLLEADSALVVNSNNDVTDGACDETHCSLREAVLYAGSGDTITFDSTLSGATITLGSQLTLEKSVTIDGSALTDRITVDANNLSRVMQVYSGVTATLDSLRLINGYTSDFGGGIHNAGNLMVHNTVLSGNQSYQGGAGIFNTGGTLLVINSSLENNLATNNVGGAISNASGGSVEVVNSTLSGNQSLSGGGIDTANGTTTTITGSTLTGNQATNSGSGTGGALKNAGTMTVVNCTLVENTSRMPGGGISNIGGTLTLYNSTLSGNIVDPVDPEDNYGHDLSNEWGSILHYANTIISNSSEVLACYNNGTISTNSNNLMTGSDYGCGASLTADPLLGPLQDNGGPTHTMALQEGSPAIDAGDDTICAAAPVNGVDQRGVTRPQGLHCDIGAYELDKTLPIVTVPRDMTVLTTDPSGAVVIFEATANDDVDGPLTPTCVPESGSTFPLGTTIVTCTATDTAGNQGSARFAVTVRIPQTLVVNSTNDEDDTVCNDPHCSLREAVNAAGIGDTITFDSSLSGATITLGGHIWINKSLNIEGLGADQLTISGDEVEHYIYGDEGDNVGGVFWLRGSYDNGVQPIEVHFSGVTIRDGRAKDGGGIFNDTKSTLEMTDCVIGPNNHALDAGGGISNKYGNLTLNRCTVWGNSQGGGDDPIGGGGIVTINSPATTMLINSTVSGNDAYNYGGGVLTYTNGIVELVHSTITNNTAGDESNLNGGGGGVNNYSGTVNIQNSILAGNFDETIADSGTDPDVSGTFNSLGGNLIGEGTSSSGWVEGDQVGTSAEPINPLLDALALNTPGTTSTHALFSGSPAIDAVTCLPEITIDQRGIDRPQGSSCDIGAFELEQITTGELKISKVFDPLTSDFAGTFTIAYDCDDGETHDGTVSLVAGASETISGIPTGTACTITEPTQPTPPTGWTFGSPTFSPGTGEVTVSEVSPAYAEVIVTNTISRDLGSLTINKVFDPLESGFTGTFAIDYDCDDGTTHDGTVNLAAGGSQTITGIPTGTICTVSEDNLPTAPDGWTFEEPAFDPDGGSVTITANTSSLMDISMVPVGAEVTVTNSISQDPDILPDTLPIATVGFHYSQQLTAIGGTPPYSWSSIGLSEVPFSLISNTGVLVSDDNLIDPATPGVITFTAIWNDSAGVEFRKELSLTVSAPLAFSPDKLSTGKVGDAYSQVITLSGGTAPYTITAENLPDWLSSETDPDSGTITLTGTPSTFGSYTVQLQATDVTGVKGAKTYNLWIGPERGFTWSPESPIQNEGVTFTPASDLGSTDMRWWRGDNPGDPCETYVVTYTSTLYIEFPAIGSYQICLQYWVDSMNDYAWDRQWVTIAEPPTFIYYFPLVQMP